MLVSVGADEMSLLGLAASSFCTQLISSHLDYSESPFKNVLRTWYALFL